ncbi:MAG: hypothetical protein ACD_51C00334G0009 [uncultured bacterium]|nr:MAG: hypothetical protein ACD_51C00334G0009 [uncultured bacterium]OGJ47366.1 MAG: hypothetical protein A2244_02655 [Candidatus Peregrinibacteria bacterium RIFOXYA2_FULL_41_18]OGJ47757.1 MAG: hypothetical protein A2344_05685 [Candidatus Peregrinibacteria bacterium RIFOXYB12_FULL_41_12]OGJ53191.1 MAG: hypothetical protein A2448_01090 [Candidatus Peregrinibacteria bacterium RIFOXYC2_FULL_41_22]
MNSTLPIILIFVLGLVFGSFLTVLIPRIHDEESGMFIGRSHCPWCKKTLRARDLIPIISYIINKAKCRFCKEKIGIIYPAIELSTAIIFTITYLTFPYPQFLFYLAISFALIFTFFYDLKYLEISDIILIPSIILALLLGPEDWKSKLIGIAIGAGFFLIQIIISKGKWVGMGDIRIGTLMGALLGWQMTIAALVISYVIGSIISIGLLASKKKHLNQQIALGPFLVTGTFITIFMGEKIVNWYLNLLI